MSVLTCVPVSMWCAHLSRACEREGEQEGPDVEPMGSGDVPAFLHSQDRDNVRDIARRLSFSLFHTRASAMRLLSPQPRSAQAQQPSKQAASIAYQQQQALRATRTQDRRHQDGEDRAHTTSNRTPLFSPHITARRPCEYSSSASSLCCYSPSKQLDVHTVMARHV